MTTDVVTSNLGLNIRGEVLAMKDVDDHSKDTTLQWRILEEDVTSPIDQYATAESIVTEVAKIF